METRGQTPARRLRKCRPSAQPTKVGISSLSSSEAAAHVWQTLKGQRGQGIFDIRDGKHPRDHLIYPPDSWIVLSNPPHCVWSTCRLGVLGKSHTPPEDSCRQEAFHDFWPIFFSPDFQHYRPSLVRPDVWSKTWDWTEEEKVRKSHGAVHISAAANNKEGWREAKSRQGRAWGRPWEAGLVSPAGGAGSQELCEILGLWKTLSACQLPHPLS